MNQEGVYGTYRVLPKSTDELRSRNDPKVTYKADKIEAVKKGEYRGTDPNLVTYKPMTYKVNKKEELLPTYAHVRAQTIRNKIEMPNTNRQTSIYHTGPAKAENTVNTPNEMRGKYRENTKIEYASDAISRNVSSSVNKHLQNKKSIKLAPTRKQITSDKSIHGGISNQSKNKSYSINRKDIPLTTLRQLMIDNKNTLGVTSNNNNKGYVFSKDFVLPTTTKETLVDNQFTGNLRKTGGQHTYNPNDVAKETIKEMFVDKYRDANLKGRDGGYVYDPNDVAKDTVKQTTVGHTRDANITGDGGYVYDPNDLAKDTIKQTTVGHTRDANITGRDGGYVYDPSDIAKNNKTNYRTYQRCQLEEETKVMLMILTILLEKLLNKL